MPGLIEDLTELVARHHSDPWSAAPPWAIALRNKVDRLLEGQEILMSQNDDLNGAVVGLTNGFAALDTAVEAELAAIAAQSPNPAITQAIANIGAITGKMAADAAAITAALPGATTVAPPPATPPEVAVPPTVTPPTIIATPVPAPAAT